MTMKTNDLAIIGSVAMSTAALTVALFLPDSLNAGNDTAPAQIVQPKFASNGVEFTLVPVENKTFKAGDEPEFLLKAVNTTAHNADATIQVAMSSTAPRSAMSRMVAMPQQLWQETSPVVLKPNETKVIALKSTAKLPENKTVTVVLKTPPPQQPTGANFQQPAQKIAPQTRVPSGVVALSYSTAKPAQAARPAAN